MSICLDVLDFPLLDDSQTSRIFEQQFSQIYFVRLNQLRPLILKNFNTQCNRLLLTLGPDHTAVHCRLLDLQLEQDSFIIGSLYIDLPNKPNVLSELSSQLNINVSFSKFLGPKAVSYVEPEDREMNTRKVFLEDESGRVELAFNSDEPINKYLTSGIVLGVTGKLSNLQRKTAFVVDSIYFASSFEVSKGIPSTSSTFNEKIAPNEVLITSSLYTPHADIDNLGVKLLFSFLSQQNERTPSCFILAGNISAMDNQEPMTVEKTSMLLDLDSRMFDYLSADKALERTIVLIPGSNDPTSIALPQRQLPKGLFPKTSTRSASQFHLSTNPCYLNINGKRVLIITGQNASDMSRYHHLDNTQENSIDPIVYAQLTLLSQHVVPTAPDTLFCYPYFSKDPFVIETLPDIYIISNQPSFATSRVTIRGQSILIVLIPCFALTNMACLLSTDNLCARPIVFNK